MQFITIIETNHKENETFIHYCQWTGNEEELEKLVKFIEFALYDDMYGDYSSFCVSRKTISEAAVNEHLGLGYGCYDHMFQKHVGVFKCPEFDQTDEFEAAKNLDDCFYACKLGNYFQNPKT